MSNLMDKTKHFLDIATYQENPQKAENVQLTESEALSRIGASKEFLTRAFGGGSKATTVELNENVVSYMNRFKQGKNLNEEESPVVYSGKANTGVVYTITKKSESDFVVSFKRPNGGTAELATYPTYNGAMFMLQSQVPSLIADSQFDTTVGVSKSEAEPETYASIDSLHESCDSDCPIKVGDTVETIKMGKQRGKVEKVVPQGGNLVKVYHRHENGKLYASDISNLKRIDEAAEQALNNAVEHILEQINVQSIEQLTEETRQEVLSIASEIAPYIER